MEEDNILSEALADAKNPLTSEDKLKAVAHWVNRQVALEDWVESLEEQLKQANKELENVRDSKLPDALAEAGCSRFDTSDGITVKLENVYYGSIPKDQEFEIYDWMAENGHEGIIESSVVIPLGKGGHTRAKEVADALLELSATLKIHNVKIAEAIHWATLRAWCKEQTEEGAELHPDIKIHAVTRAKIKRPKHRD